MHEPATLDWVKPPQQDRSQRTLDALLDAAEALLAEQPFEAIAVAAIAERAGSSVGSFYARFEGKQDLLRALYARYRDTSAATLRQVGDPAHWAGVPLPQVVHAAVAFLVADHRARRGLRRAFSVACPSDAPIRAMVAEVTADTLATWTALLTERRAEHAHADPAAAAEFCHRLLFSTLETDLWADEGWPTGSALSDQQLTDGLCLALLGYLGVPR